MSQILINNVQKVFTTPGGPVVALKDIQLTIQPGELSACWGRPAAANPPC